MNMYRTLLSCFLQLILVVSACSASNYSPRRRMFRPWLSPRRSNVADEIIDRHDDENYAAAASVLRGGGGTDPLDGFRYSTPPFVPDRRYSSSLRYPPVSAGRASKSSQRRRRWSDDNMNDDDDDSTRSNEEISSSRLDSFMHWTRNHIDNWPQLHVHFQPRTILKLRKRLFPTSAFLGWTQLVVGADFCTDTTEWKLHTSWKDDIIGGTLTLANNQVHLSKSWPLSVLDDVLVTRLHLQCSVGGGAGAGGTNNNWWSHPQASVRLGLKTDRLSPLGLHGLVVRRCFKLDGPEGHVQLESQIKLDLPQPELVYSTTNAKSSVGLGRIDVTVQELNLVLEY